MSDDSILNAETQSCGEEQRKARFLSPLFLSLCVSAFIGLLTLVVFIQVRSFEYINVDDPQYVLDNPHVRGGLNAQSAAWAFTTLRLANWHPLTWLSHLLDVTLFGLAPGGPHVVNVLLHMLNACLVYLVLKALTGSNWKSAIVAALFAVHPLRMESVAWIAERKDVLSALFFLLAIWAYERYVRLNSKQWYAAMVGAFALGIMAKPMVVTLPAVLLLLDFWPLKRPVRFGSLVVEKIPLFLMAIASGVLTFFAQHAGGAVMSQSRLPVATRVANSIWAYGRYLRKTIWPSDLAAFYPFPAEMPWMKVAISAASLVIITLAALSLWKKERSILIGWLWFLGMLVPTIGLIQVGRQSMADRYSYLPHVGLFVAIVWGVGALAEHWRGIRGLSNITACVAIAAFAGVTTYQLRYWENSYTLFTHAMQVTDNNSNAALCVGMYLSEKHRDPEAVKYYEYALSTDPSNADAHMNLANVLASRGDAKSALAHVERAIELRPDSAQAHNNIANVLVALGKPEDALAHHAKAIAIDPDSAQAFYNYGVTLAQLGRLNEAAEKLSRANALRSDYADARYVYGLTLASLGKPAAAVEQFAVALQIRPDWPKANKDLAWILATTPDERVADPKTAVALARRACELTQFRNPQYLDTLAAALARAGAFEPAIQAAEQVLAIAGNVDPAFRRHVSERLAGYHERRPYISGAVGTTQPAAPRSATQSTMARPATTPAP